MKVLGIVWMGVRSSHYRELRDLFGVVMGMERVHTAAGVTWFVLPDGEQIQLYDDTDLHHTFFGEQPVVGFLVEDFARARAEMMAAGVEFLGTEDTDGRLTWEHFRGPDGNVYEILGPASAED